ncbi:Prp31p [Malassezia vespertilionis]|uniref:Prp31p n=1 Tax=Malassezia vespertilionis TaxID=2020962 RepID=A0A2N1JGW6_9BASI|nr:Prp31p [Malassezia vespertilionis]
MASLADELLAEVEEDVGVDAGTHVSQNTEGVPVYHETDNTARDVADDPMHDASMLPAHGASRPPDALDQATLDSMDFGTVEVSMAQPPPSAMEASPEYPLIVRANNMAVELDNEVLILHRFIRERYAPRFPELETLVLNPWEFIQAVRALGNDKELRGANVEGILPHGTVVVISMSASNTTGRPLPVQEWEKVQEASEMALSLEAMRRKVSEYVESRMTLLAPNLSALVGTRVATKLVGVAGGLAGLAKIPSCNVHLIGASKKQHTGLNTNHGASTRFSGFLAQAAQVENTPEDYRMQALRMLAAKASLAARMDASGASHARTGSYGASLRAEVERKIEKLLEPPPAKLIKALPVPSEGGRKQRRGGRRARKFREMHGLTELRKMQNRVEFGKEEEEAGAFDATVGLGMINTKASGKIRATTANASSKARMSKANKTRLAAMNRPSLSLLGQGTPSTSGTASSLSFTPVQGIELVDPSRQKKVDEANAKWFSEGQFSLVPGTTGSAIPGLGTKDAKPMAPPAPRPT